MKECAIPLPAKAGSPLARLLWLRELDERERMEISWARDYATLYTETGFYTEGHNRLLLLAHLAELLDGKETAQEEEPPPRS